MQKGSIVWSRALIALLLTASALVSGSSVKRFTIQTALQLLSEDPELQISPPAHTAIHAESTTAGPTVPSETPPTDASPSNSGQTPSTPGAIQGSYSSSRSTMTDTRPPAASTPNSQPPPAAAMPPPSSPLPRQPPPTSPPPQGRPAASPVALPQGTPPASLRLPAPPPSVPRAPQRQEARSQTVAPLSQPAGGPKSTLASALPQNTRNATAMQLVRGSGHSLSSPSAVPDVAVSSSLPADIQARTNPLTQVPAPASSVTNLTTLLLGKQPALAPTVIQKIVSEAASGNASQTSLAAEIEIQGPGSTPFNLDNQNLLINAYASVMTSVTRADFSIRYYTSDTDRVPNFHSRRRLLMIQDATHSGRLLLQDVIAQPEALLADTVFVTLQINAGSNYRTPTVVADLNAAMKNTNGTVPVQQALQAYGQSQWSLVLLSMNAINPAQPLAVELICNSKFGSICLDGSGLSQGAVKGIIAGGVIFIVLAFSMICVFIDVKRRTGRMGELEMHPETPRTPMQRAMASLSTYLHSALGAVRTPRRAGGAQRGALAPDPAPSLPASAEPGSPVTATVAVAEDKSTSFKDANAAPSVIVVDTVPAESGKGLPEAPGLKPINTGAPRQTTPGADKGGK